MRKDWRVWLLPLAVLALSSGCVDEKIVFQDRELFEEPLAAAGDFLGYTDHDTKLTVCGNCHINKAITATTRIHARLRFGITFSRHQETR